jgi:hypothetical protein
MSLFCCPPARSIQIIDPLLTPEQRARPSWRSWRTLVELYALVVQFEFTDADIKRIDDLVLEHSALFDAVPVYNGLKRPKHHFMCHLAQNIFDWGPPRGYWCFGFEGYNKVIKKGGRRSNWMHESHDVMKWWAVRKARALRRTYAAVETVDS